MTEITPIETLYDIKRHLDNGFNGKQTAKKLGVSEAIVTRLRNGHYGPMPEFPHDLKMRFELRKINLEQLNKKIRS